MAQKNKQTIRLQISLLMIKEPPTPVILLDIYISEDGSRAYNWGVLQKSGMKFSFRG